MEDFANIKTFRFSASDGYFLLATSYSITSTTTACVALAFSVGSLVNEDDSRLSTMMSHALHPLHNHRYCRTDVCLYVLPLTGSTNTG